MKRTFALKDWSAPLYVSFLMQARMAFSVTPVASILHADRTMTPPRYDVTIETDCANLFPREEWLVNGRFAMARTRDAQEGK